MNRTTQETELYQRYRQLGLAAVRPRVRQHDQTHCFDRQAWQTLGAADFHRLPVHCELGGLGLPLAGCAAAMEGLADGSGDLGFSVSAVAHWVCLLTLQEFGSAEQLALYMPRLVSGEWIGAVANAETQAGTNLMAITSSACQAGPGFELNAQKNSITNVGVAELVLCSARLVDAPPRKEVNIFLVESAGPGVQTRTFTHLAGLRSSCTGDLTATRATLPACALLGEVGQGLSIFRVMFALERLFTGVLYLAGLRACLQRALTHAETRLQFGRPIGRNQYVQEKIVRMRVAEQMLASLLRELFRAVQCGEDVSEQLSIVKVHGIETAIKASEDLMRLLGGRGMSQEELAEKYHRDLLALSILGGTVELQKIVMYQELSRRWAGELGGAPARRTEVTLTVHCVTELDERLERALVDLTSRLFPNEPALAGKFYYDSRPDRVVAAWKDGQLAGFRIVTRRRVDLGPGVLRVAGMGIGVEPRWQRQGVGTELTRRTLELLREEGDDLALAFLFSPAAEPLLRSFGFTPLQAQVTYRKRDSGELVVESVPALALDLHRGTLVEDLNLRGSLHLGVGSW
jgi:alkylation response protein AidB-like acyl-CoA dehydrogenase/GNAT superfamily N-acetyltransferase